MRKSTAKTKEGKEQLLEGMPKEYYDEVRSYLFIPGSLIYIFFLCGSIRLAQKVDILVIKKLTGQEWQAQQREKTKELERLRKQEKDEEERMVENYREIGIRLNGYPEEDVKKAKKLVSSFIRAEEEVEEVIKDRLCAFLLRDSILAGN